MNDAYVHGYDLRESVRLQDQAATLVDLLHAGTFYPPGGSHSRSWVWSWRTDNYPRPQQPGGANHIGRCFGRVAGGKPKGRVEAAGIVNVQFQQADIFALPFAPESFDHVFVCFVLEHLACPVEALAATAERVLRPGGTVTVSSKGTTGQPIFIPTMNWHTGRFRAKSNYSVKQGVMRWWGGSFFPY